MPKNRPAIVHQSSERDVSCVTLRDGVRCEQTEHAPNFSRTQEEERNKIGAISPFASNVLPEVVAIGDTICAQNSRPSEKWRIANDCAKSPGSVEEYLWKRERPMDTLTFLFDRYFVRHIGSQPAGRSLEERPGRSALDRRPIIVQGDPDTLHLGVEALLNRRSAMTSSTERRAHNGVGYNGQIGELARSSS